VVLPQVTGTGAAWRQFSGMDSRWLWAALGLEAASLAVYAALTRALIPRPGRPGYARLLGIDLATMAASHVVPAGSAVGLGLGYRLLTAAGVRGPSAVSAKAVQAVGSAVVLNALLWVALVVSVAQHGAGSGYGVAAALGAVLMSGAALLLVLLLRGGDRVAGAVAGALGRLPKVSDEGARAGLAAVVDHLRQLTADRRLLTAATAWAAANWLLDAAALWACVRASGAAPGIDGTFVAYGIAAVVAALPITPGGLGVVEASLIPSLIAAGAPHGAAVLGVLAWRGLTFLLPIPVGAVSFAMLQRRPLLRPQYPAAPDALREDDSRTGSAPYPSSGGHDGARAQHGDDDSRRPATAGIGRGAGGDGPRPAGRDGPRPAHPSRGRRADGRRLRRPLPRRASAADGGPAVGAARRHRRHPARGLAWASGRPLSAGCRAGPPSSVCDQVVRSYTVTPSSVVAA
jgi:hypothetical protein